MYNFWSHATNYPAFRQLGLITGLLLTSVCLGQTSPVTSASRHPASYVPDDDVIIKPEHNEVSFYQKYVASDNSSEVVKLRNQLKVWNDNEQFADQYGLRKSLAGSPYFAPTEEQKWEYFKDKYFRYMRREAEQPVKDMPKNWYQEYRASNEVDTIDEIEGRFEKTQKKSSNGSLLPKALQVKEVNVSKKTKLIFQPRVDQGLVLVGIKSSNLYARAWVAANKETEVNVQHKLESIGNRVMFNYFATTGKYFTSMDQRIIGDLSARYTTSKDPLTKVTDNTVMLLYARQF